MPDSSYKALTQILDIIKPESPGSILEISTGSFKIGLHLRDSFELPSERYNRSNWKLRLDSVETAYRPDDFVSRYIYNNLYTGGIMELAAELPIYDIIILIDVLQHYTKEEGRLLLHKLSKHSSKSIIASITVNYKLPDAQVKSRWSVIDLVDFDSTSSRIKIDNEELFIFKVHPDLNCPVTLHKNETPLLIPHVEQSLTIGYILPHKGLTGGLKMLMEQIRHMRRRGHRIYVLYRGDPGEAVLPEWSNVEADREILIPKDRSYKDYITGCDIVYSGFFDQLPELSGCGIPVFYWEQGYPWLFGDIPDTASAAPACDFMRNCYSQPCMIASVSRTIANIMNVRFGRDTVIIPNGIDTDFYQPGTPPDDGTIILTGNPYLQFKGFETTLLTLQAVWDTGYRFKVNWVSQVMPQIAGITFPVNFIINPSQRDLSLCYMRSDIHLFTSWYEGFGMPPLEAMSCGVPVVATKCGGIETYAIHGYNALLAEPGDMQQLGLYIIYLLQNKEARTILSNRGRETALQYSFPKVVEKLEGYLYSLVNNKNG